MADPTPPYMLPDWALNLLAGLIGGAVRAATQPEQSWWQRVVTSFVGGVTAMYLTPIMAPLVSSYLAAYSVSYSNVAGFCGFILGMMGLAATELAIRQVRKRIGGAP